MCRVLVAAWGADSAKYAGRSMTLYNDPDVLWAGMKVGGIRISHMSHIDSPITLALAENKKNRKLFTVKPLPTQRDNTPAVASPPATAAETPLIDAGQSAGAASSEDKAAQWTAETLALIDMATDREQLALVQSGRSGGLVKLAKDRPELLAQINAAIADRNEAFDGKRVTA
jgi:hypothetical protein